jgi:hypothetical protein
VSAVIPPSDSRGDGFSPREVDLMLVGLFRGAFWLALAIAALLLVTGLLQWSVAGDTGVLPLAGWAAAVTAACGLFWWLARPDGVGSPGPRGGSTAAGGTGESAGGDRAS